MSESSNANQEKKNQQRIAREEAIQKTSSETMIKVISESSLATGGGVWFSEEPNSTLNLSNFHQIKHPTTKSTTADFFEYAASVPLLHCSDAWGYFARAISAISAGSLDIAQHLLYYCELRAAKATLASHGIFGIGKNNFYIDATGTTQSLNQFLSSPETHTATWEMFTSWSKVSGPEYLRDSIRYRGYSLGDWADSFGGSEVYRGVFSELIKSWGIDLSAYTNDRTSRNKASYDPTLPSLRRSGQTPASITALLQEIWVLLEPSGPGSFESMDSFLVRKVLDELYLASPHAPGAGEETEPDEDIDVEAGLTKVAVGHFDTADFNSFVERMVTDLIGPSANSPVLDHLRGKNRYPDPDILISANSTLDVTSQLEQTSAMVGRALILMRLATGAVFSAHDASGVTQEAKSVWAFDLLASRGLGDMSQGSVDAESLWGPISAAREDVDTLLNYESPTDLSVVRDHQNTVNWLTSFECVPCWILS